MSDVDRVLHTLKAQLESLPEYGQLQVHLKRHRGDYNSTDVVRISSVRFDDDEPNVSVTTRIFQLVKSIADAGESGNLTFNVTFKQGLAEQMTVQDFRKL